jgi:RNA polymerase sigma-70 factor, ECF subfamily
MKMHFQKSTNNRKDERMNRTISWEEPLSHTITEDTVMVQTAQQNPAAFQPIYQKWLKPIYRYFFFRVGNIKDAEDLTSQVFLKVYEDLPKYHGKGYFSAWLFSIAHARMVDYFRKTKASQPLDEAERLSNSTDLLTQVVHGYEIEHLISVINKLNEHEQELIRLRFFAELSYREIGEILHRSEDAVRKSIARLLDRMQVEMEESND